MFLRPLVPRFWKERSVADNVAAGVSTRTFDRSGWRQPPLHRRKFPLQRRARFDTFQNVRTLVAIGIICFGISTAFAQKQERHLIDRLLKPDLELANPAQNKKFSDKQHSVSFEKPARTASFYSAQKPVAKSFPNERSLTPRQFAARHFRAGDSAAYISSRSHPPKSDTMIAAPVAAAGTRVAPESKASAQVREYADNRPFLGEGKSQKALHAQDKPLSIEQVRELLNKSK
jgi:hypothetical protein